MCYASASTVIARALGVALAASLAVALPARADDAPGVEDGERLQWPPPPAWSFPDEEPEPAPAAPRSLDEARRAPPPPAEPAPRESSLRWYPRTLDCHVRLSAWVLPALDAVALVEGDRWRGLSKVRANVKAAPGIAAAISFGKTEDAGWFGVGLYYHGSRHAEHRRGGALDIHAAYLEGQLDVAVPEEGPVRLVLGGGLGLGAAVLDFHRPEPGQRRVDRRFLRDDDDDDDGRRRPRRQRDFSDTGGVALEARAHVGLRLFEHLEVTAGAGWFCWGLDGVTEGHGGYLSLGATLRF